MEQKDEIAELKEELKLCMACIDSLEDHFLVFGHIHGFDYKGPKIENWDELCKKVGYKDGYWKNLVENNSSL